MVTVLNKTGYPLMPCSESRARRLLAQQKAKIVKRRPFTIQLLYGSSGYMQSADKLLLSDETPFCEEQSFDASCEDSNTSPKPESADTSRTTQVTRQSKKAKQKSRLLCIALIIVSIALIVTVGIMTTAFTQQNPVAFNKEMYSTKNFVYTSGKAALNVVDVYKHYKDDPGITTAYIAIKKSDHATKALWKIEHYTMRDEKVAETVFNYQLETVKNTISANQEEISIKEAEDWQVCEIKTATAYVYMLRIDDILIAVNTDIKYEKDVTEFMNMLNEHQQERES